VRAHLLQQAPAHPEANRLRAEAGFVHRGEDKLHGVRVDAVTCTQKVSADGRFKPKAKPREPWMTLQPRGTLKPFWLTSQPNTSSAARKPITTVCTASPESGLNTRKPPFASFLAATVGRIAESACS
jgi:hypothetical protein